MSPPSLLRNTDQLLSARRSERSDRPVLRQRRRVCAKKPAGWAQVHSDYVSRWCRICGACTTKTHTPRSIGVNRGHLWTVENADCAAYIYKDAGSRIGSHLFAKVRVRRSSSRAGLVLAADALFGERHPGSSHRRIGQSQIRPISVSSANGPSPAGCRAGRRGSSLVRERGPEGSCSGHGESDAAR